MRPDKRALDQIRPINYTLNYTIHAEGSVLVSCGQTKVLCTISVTDGVPGFLKGKGTGWLTAEYSMLPRSTVTRVERDRFKVKGRTYEIQRLIGRSLRGIIDLNKLGERTITIDADVLQADGGTRTAAVNGSFMALVIAMSKLVKEGKLPENPIIENLGAISVGMLDNTFRLDLMYEEDSQAQVDMNVVMTEKGQFIEVQGTGEERNYSRKELDKMLDLAEKGIHEIIAQQKEVMKKEGYK